MKLPRDVSGHDLAQRLRQFGYEVTRQTLSGIVGAVADHLGKDRAEVIDELFG